MECKVYIIDKGKIKEVIIPKDDRISCGVETFFFPVNSRRALKVFAEKKNARNSFNRQKKAFEHGLAPKVLSNNIFEVMIPMGFDSMFKRKSPIYQDLHDMLCGNRLYGYYTQIIKMVNSEKDYTEEEEKELINKLYKLFPDVSLDDIHDGNVGRIDGKLVMVDFGDESAS